MNRALRAVTLGVLLLSPVALSACSAGQVTQTEIQDRDKTGPMSGVGDLDLRQMKLAYPSGGSYQPGDDAELQMTIVNHGSEDDALVDITGDAFSDVRITGGGTAQGSGGSDSGSPQVAIPAGSTVFLGQQGAPTVTLGNLRESLTPGQSIDLTLQFQKAGEVDVHVQVATSKRNQPRGDAFNFSDENKSGNEVAHGAGTGNGG